MKFENKFVIVAGVFLVIVLSLGGYWIWGEQTNWIDTGSVSWVGQKTFSVNGWNTPYAFMTNNHGTLNFTTIRNPYGNLTLHQCPNVSICIGYDLSGVPGAGIIRNNFGEYRLVVDP